MASISTDQLTRPLALPLSRPLTAADLLEMPTELPSGPVDYELDNGRLVLMSPTSDKHGEIQLAIGSELRTQGQQKGLGKAYVETGVILWKNPDRVVGPDVSFISTRSLPVRKPPEGYLETIPELVVEVRSKNDTAAYLNRKVADYLHAGVQLVWVVDPDTNTAVEHRTGVAPKNLTTADVLVCDDIIPGFRLPLAELFKE
jgi:Uma2 family endonuclease